MRRLFLTLALPAAALGGLQGASLLGLAPSPGRLAAGMGEAGLRSLGATVQDVTVSGRRNARAHEVLAAVNVDRGGSMLAFDAARARARVLDVDWVGEATVSRLFPGTIHVAIVEREPFAVWQKGKVRHIIDGNASVITEATAAALEQLPYIVGEGAPEAAEKLLAMLKARPALRVRAAVRVGQRRWTLKLEDGVEVMLPAAGIEVALDELIRLDDATGLLGRNVRVVDLRIPDRLTVKTREEADADKNGDAKT
jgi:cell division protein FtsQ